MNSHPEVFAYKKISKDFTKENNYLIQNLTKLLKLSKEISSPLLDRLKPTILLSIKWKFDYLAKTLQSPFEINNDIKY